MIVVVIGKSGQLAEELRITKPKDFEVHFFGRSNVDILDPDNLNQVILPLKPHIIINASAYTMVEKAEDEVDYAYQINEMGVVNLIGICNVNKSKLIHVSTDFIFDGKKNSPYVIEDQPSPLNIYGASKLAGEKAILASKELNSCIIRTSWVYSSFGNNFVKTILRLIKEKNSLEIISDQLGAPTNANALARFIWTVISNNVTEKIMHWTDKGHTSWYGFAREIYKIAKELDITSKEIDFEPISSSEYPANALRPAYSVLDISGSQKIFLARPWQENLRQCIEQIKKKKEL